MSFLTKLKSREWARLVFDSRLLDSASATGQGSEAVANAMRMFGTKFLLFTFKTIRVELSSQ